MIDFRQSDPGITRRHVLAMGPLVVLFVCGVACRERTQSTDRLHGSALTTTTTADAGATRPAAKRATPPRTTERTAERHQMVERQIVARGIRNPRVLEAMRNVPRHWFVPQSARSQAYQDRPLRIGHGQTISQPYIVALMSELLEIEAADKVLEIGTGSGYQAAVLVELARDVYTIEIVEPLAQRTIRLLEDKAYDEIHTRIGDGYRGWPEQAPFDAIIVTCAPETPPPALIEQLAVGGRMCIPVGPQSGNQELVLIEKLADGSLLRSRVSWVRFVPMTGTAKRVGE